MLLYSQLRPFLRDVTRRSVCQGPIGRKECEKHKHLQKKKTEKKVASINRLLSNILLTL